MRNQLMKDPQRRLQIYRAVALGAAVLYLLFGLLYQHGLPEEDLLPLSHRLFFFGILFLLFLASYRIALVQKHMGPVLYGIAVLAVLDVLFMGARDQGFDGGAIVALLLVIPVMNVLFYRWQALLYVNVLLLLMVIGAFSIADLPILETALLIGSALFISAISLYLTRRLLIFEHKAEESTQLFQEVFHHSMDAIALHELLVDSEGQARDYVFLKVNPAFETFTGLKAEDIIDRRVTEVLPDIEETSFIQIYGDVVQKGEAVSFEDYSSPLNRYYRIVAYPIGGLRFVTAFADITRRKQMEKELQENQRRFSLAQRFANMGTWEYHIPSGALHWSKECEALFGLEEGEFEGTFDAFMARIHPEDRDYVIETNAPIIHREEGIPLEYEHRIVTTEGEVRWVRESAGVVHDENGKANSIIGLIIDITEEREALERDRFLSTVMTHISDAVLVTDKNFRITYSNHKVQELYGYTFEELQGQDPSLLNGESRGIALQEELYEMAGDGKEHIGEMLGRRKDGSTFICEYKVTSIADEDGEAHTYISIQRDITRRKKREEALQESESRLRNITESTLDAVLMMNPRGEISFWNPAAEKIFGYTEEEALGQDVHKLLAPERYYSSFRRAFPRFQQTGEGQAVNKTLELEAVCKDGQEISVELSLKALKLADGWHAVGVLRDSTERKQAEEKLASYAVNLELKNLEVEALYNQLDEELKKARDLHESILPLKLPTIPGVAMATYFQPAQRIGGDSYNIIHTGDTLLFYFSDVTGHGLEGAQVSVFVKEAVDSFRALRPGDSSPENILRHVYNQYRENDYPHDYFISFFLGQLDLKTFELTFAGAGFQESILLRQGDSMATLSVTGPPISSVIRPEQMNFSERVLSVSPDSTIMVNTDGLSEQTVGNKTFLKRKEELFSHYSHLPPEFFKRILNEEFREFNEGTLQGQDDITYFILQLEKEDTIKRSFTLKSDVSQIQAMERKLEDFFGPEALDHTFCMGLHELVVNAMEHGNGLDSEKSVHITIYKGSRYLCASVEDEGSGFSWRKALLRPFDLDTGQGRGRGLALIQLASEYFVYNEQGNKGFIVRNFAHTGLSREELPGKQ